MIDPDDCIFDFLGYRPDPQRYDTNNRDPLESTAIVASLVPVGSRVLDVGCGIGAIGSLLMRCRSATVIGFEPNQSRAEIASQRGLTVYNCYIDAESIKSLDEFDVLLFADVLEHLPDPGALLRLASTKLRPGGKLIISVPNVAHWSIRASLLFGKFTYDQYGIMDATHLRWFTRHSLHSFLLNVGFHVSEERFTAGFTLPVYSTSALKYLPARLRRRSIAWLSQSLPNLFACQFVISAVRSEALDAV